MASLSTFDAFKHLNAEHGEYVLSAEDLKNLQNVLTKMLGEILEVCERHDIECLLVGGSCLGAVRHQGFIPWDDDLDIGMLRADYERFKQVFAAELGERYILQSPEDTEGYGLAFSRLRLKGTTLKCRDDFFAADENCGVYIDLFVWDDVPDNVVLRAAHGFLSLCIGFAYSCRRFAWYGPYYLRLVQGNEELTRTFKTKMLLGRLLSFMSVDGWTKLWYRWNSLIRSGKTRSVSFPCGRKHYFGEIQERSSVASAIEVPFGDITARVPRNYHDYLVSLYGENYMVPPPEAAREEHIVFAFDLGEEA